MLIVDADPQVSDVGATLTAHTDDRDAHDLTVHDRCETMQVGWATRHLLTDFVLGLREKPQRGARQTS
jgi:hypothetical protein